MKQKILRAAFVFASAVVTVQAHAYKYVIFTDEAATNKSEEVAKLMKTTYPFNKFHIEVEIVRVPASTLECASIAASERAVTCKDIEGIQMMARDKGGDQAMIVKNSPQWGGSSAVGGGVPVITTGTSARAMLHEYLHTLGLCDEYEYKASEAGFYCGSTAKATPNLVFIDPVEPYHGDEEARQMHAGNIPWFSEINSHTLITGTAGTRLGTTMVNSAVKAPQNTSNLPSALQEPTGLYQGKICNQALKSKKSWQPGSSSTIMENVDAGLGAPLEKIVERIMVSKGIQKKMQVTEEEPIVDRKIAQLAASSVIVEPEPQAEVNNTGRSFFKSFFQWIQDIFTQFANALTK